MRLIFLAILALCASTITAQSLPGGGSGGASMPTFFKVTAGVAVIPDGGIHLVNMNDTISGELFKIAITNVATTGVTLTTTITNLGSTGMVESDWEGGSNVPFDVVPMLGSFNTAGGVVHQVTIVATNSAVSTSISFSLVQDHPLLTVREGLNEVEHSQDAASTGRDFGSQQVSAGPTGDLTITILNTGNAPLNMGTPTVTGSAATEFVITSFPGMTVPGSNSTTFTVAFEPTTAGVHVASIEFTHNDTTTQTPFIFEVTGVGIPTTPAPILLVRESGPTGAVIVNGSTAAGMRDFGSVLLTDMPTTSLTIYIENAGNADMTLALPTITGNGFFIDTSNFVTLLTPGNSFTLGIVFDTQIAGPTSTSISFGHDDTTTATPFSFEVAGLAGDGLVDFGSSGGGAGCTSGNSAPIGIILLLLGVVFLLQRRRTA
ncbi:MAG: choice-of-anchor D domain-containing protein [Planctomycetes bacterium]|nr:choice-of-anchor D domain-containing protein [Planctomycetota bacterium]